APEWSGTTRDHPARTRLRRAREELRRWKRKGSASPPPQRVLHALGQAAPRARRAGRQPRIRSEAAVARAAVAHRGGIAEVAEHEPAPAAARVRVALHPFELGVLSFAAAAEHPPVHGGGMVDVAVHHDNALVRVAGALRVFDAQGAGALE